MVSATRHLAGRIHVWAPEYLLNGEHVSVEFLSTQILRRHQAGTRTCTFKPLTMLGT